MRNTSSYPTHKESKMSDSPISKPEHGKNGKMKVGGSSSKAGIHRVTQKGRMPIGQGGKMRGGEK